MYIFIEKSWSYLFFRPSCSKIEDVGLFFFRLLQIIMTTSGNGLPDGSNIQVPNHIILWLDQSFEGSGSLQNLKEAFSTATDPCRTRWTNINGPYCNGLLLDDEYTCHSLKHRTSSLAVFDNEEECLQAFEQNRDKRIFFITSGSFGRTCIPTIISKYRKQFTDSANGNPYEHIYVLCCDIESHKAWAIKYVDYVQIFDFDTVLLKHLTHDIAEYYIAEGKRYYEKHQVKNALQCFRWAENLWDKYEQMLRTNGCMVPYQLSELNRMNKISQLIENAEMKLQEIMNKDGTDEEGNSLAERTTLSEYHSSVFCSYVEILSKPHSRVQGL